MLTTKIEVADGTFFLVAYVVMLKFFKEHCY